MTDMTESTKVIPITAKYKPFPVNATMLAAKPPNAKEPVSPMKTDAGETLKKRYAKSAPTRQKETVDIFLFPPCKRINKPMQRKYGTHEPAASPSKPSVKLTAFTVAKKRKNVKGNAHTPISMLLFVKGMCSEVNSARTA